MRHLRLCLVALGWLLVAGALACGDDASAPPPADAGPRPDAARPDAGPSASCADDGDCDDGSYCNGPERCVRDDSGRLGCVRGSPPCEAGSRCDEDTRACSSECPDQDGDGHRDASCGGDDCADADADRFPGNPERCDAVDQDCDPETLGPDTDGDGSFAAGCCNPGGAAPACGDDCDDDDPDRHPGQPEACNGIDDDCDGALEPGEDDDGDGHAFDGCGGDDCDDTAPAVHPGAPELCDGVDNDCDGARPEWDDADGDGYAADVPECRGGMLPTTDCDDRNASIHPSAPEVCDGVDDDCDGNLPAGDDADGDGYAATDAVCEPGTAPRTDCDDADPDVHPGSTAACVIGLDRDCDGLPASLRGGATAVITSAPRDRSQPTAAALGPNLLVAWVDLRGGGAPAVYAKLVRPDGAAVPGSTDALLSTGTGTASRPVALADGSGGAVVVYSQGRQLLLRTVSATGVLGGTSIVLAEAGSGAIEGWAVRAGAGLVAIWSEVSPSDPLARVVSAGAFELDGSPAAPPQVLTAATRSGSDPRVGSSAAGVWAAWVQAGPESGDLPAIWARPLDVNATPTSAAVMVSASPGRASAPAVGALPSGSAVLVWVDDRDGAPDTELYARNVSASGTLGLERRLTTAPGVSRSPFIVGGGLRGDLTLAWEDGRDGTAADTEIYLTELDANAMLVGSEERVTNAGGLSQAPWVLQVSGAPWLAFRDTRSGGADIYVRELACED